MQRKNLKRHSIAFSKFKEFFKVYIVISGIVAFVYQWDSTIDRLREMRDSFITIVKGSFSLDSLFLNLKEAVIGFIRLLIETGNTIGLSTIILIYGFGIVVFGIGILLSIADHYRKGVHDSFFNKFGNLYAYFIGLFGIGFLAYHLLFSDHFWAGQDFINKCLMAIFGWFIAACATFGIRYLNQENKKKESSAKP